MKILAIDTSASAIGIGIYDGAYHAKITTPDPKSHNKNLLAEIDAFCRELGTSVRDMDYFGVVVGPGSFTGIRIGVATVNAFAMATKKKVVEMTSLEVPAGDGEIMTLLDCKHNNYYVGLFHADSVQYGCMKKEETEAVDLPKIYLEGTYPEKMLRLAVKKIEREETVNRAKPFYIKSSSAETGE